MSLVLGVDGGGTKTRAALFEASASGSLAVVSEGIATGSNPYSVGWDAAKSAIAECVRQACSPSSKPAEAAVLAIAGCASPEARDQLLVWSEGRSFAGRTWVVPDTEPLLADAPSDQPVVGLIAGTGSAAIVRPAGEAAEVLGGWGYLIDDIGSGYALGRDALRRVADVADAGAAADALTAALLREAGVGQPTELKTTIYGSATPRARIASFAPLVLRLAEAGDPIASQIVAANVEGLVRLAENARTRAMKLEPTSPGLLLAGGVLHGSAHYHERVVGALIATGWSESRISDAPEPTTGCAQIALARLREQA